MFWSKTKKESALPTAVFDIGGSAVSALLMDGQKKNAAVRWSQKFPFSSSNHHDSLHFERDIFQTLDKAINHLQAVYGGRLKGIHCLLSSAWHLAEPSQVHREYLGQDGGLEKVQSDLAAEALAAHLA